MKVNKQNLQYFIRVIKHDYPNISDNELADKLATYIENNPSTIDVNETNKPNRFSYSTVGYGVYSLLGEKYHMGRIEVFDSHNDSPYQIDEGSFCVPHSVANIIQDFFDSLQTELPIEINIGSIEHCKEECAKELNLNPDDLHNPEVIKQYREYQNNTYAQIQGYDTFNDLVKHKLKLTLNDEQIMTNTINNPPPPNEELKNATKDYKKKIE